MLQATRVWWQILFDIDSPALDPEFQRSVDAAIASTEAWTAREPENAEAWFYQGGAYGARVQFRAYRKEYCGAARDGKRVKESMERALALDASLVDANFGLGLYEYYADIAPAAAKFLPHAAVPPGRRPRRGIEAHGAGTRARRRHGGEAAFQLHVIDLWYERQFTARARPAATSSSAATREPVSSRSSWRTCRTSISTTARRSLATWRQLLDRGTRGTVNEAALATARARFGAAQQLDALYETDAAIELLRALVAASPQAPFGVVSKAQLVLGRAFDRVGDRNRALTAYAAAATSAPAGDPQGVRSAAHQAQRAPAPPAATTRAYRLSLDGLARARTARRRRRGARAVASRSPCAKTIPSRATDWRRCGSRNATRTRRCAISSG